MPKIVIGPEQFYFAGYVFSTKKEMKDRVKQLLLHIADDDETQLDHLGRSALGSFQSSVLDPGTVDSTRRVFSLLSDLVSRHPNFEKWGNKIIEKYKVTRADTKKRPPILWAEFSGAPGVWRNMKWPKLM